MCDRWQATITELSYHRKKLKHESEMFTVSNAFWEEIFAEFDRIAAQPSLYLDEDKILNTFLILH